MPIVFIFAILSLSFSLLTYFFTPLVQNYWNLFLLIPFFIGYYVLIACFFIVFLFITCIFLRRDAEVDKPKRWVYSLMRMTCEAAFFFMRHKLVIKGMDKIPDEPVCYVYNHLAMFDPILIMIYLEKKNLVCLTKQENIRIPVGGNYMIHSGYVPIDRTDDFQAAKAIVKFANYGKQGYSLAIAPEGTRNKTEEPLLPFHAGVFKIPLKAKVPMVLVGFKGNKTIFPYFFKFKKTNLETEIIDVIPYDSYKDMNTFQISDMVRAKMLAYVTGQVQPQIENTEETKKAEN